MSASSNYQLFSLVSILLLITIDRSSQSQATQENDVKSGVFLSPAFVLEPGSVSHKFYYNIGFPKGHIAIKNFDAEGIDEARNLVPLYETYLHHWGYVVESCATSVANVDCTHTKKIGVIFPSGGDPIYGVAHQHIGGTGMALHGEDGRVIYSSLPIYGKGKEPGNEAGYIVGMSSCYPRPGSIKLSEGETITLLSNYSNDQRHTGVFSLFYLLVAEPSLKHNSILHSADGTGEIVILQNAVGALVVFGIALLVCAVVIYQRRNTRDQDGYEFVYTDLRFSPIGDFGP
ncbi:hypothetical protein H5410_062269 [Solanum commersonii]|uniref:Uncharacterized protein n=1 Tax=Solanum commersonii TaxID=4109 RepID=A0A9J5WB16_SOLCO|nr:hypothetical protein H5410_062269 [Solanum commersonii]